MAVGWWQSFPKVELFAAALCELVSFSSSPKKELFIDKWSSLLRFHSRQRKLSSLAAQAAACGAVAWVLVKIQQMSELLQTIMDSCWISASKLTFLEVSS